jgi:hypothetical protein
VSKLICLSQEDHDHDWFATRGLFDWAVDFIRPHIDDPRLLEELESGIQCGYLFVGALPEPHRTRVLLALRDELPAMVDRDLYPPPVAPHERPLTARLKRLAEMAGDLCPAPNPVQDATVTAMRTTDGWWLGLTAGRWGSRHIARCVLSDLAEADAWTDEDLRRLTGFCQAELTDLAGRIAGAERFTPGEVHALSATLAAYASPEGYGHDGVLSTPPGLSRQDIAALSANLDRVLEAVGQEPPAW